MVGAVPASAPPAAGPKFDVAKEGDEKAKAEFDRAKEAYDRAVQDWQAYWLMQVLYGRALRVVTVQRGIDPRRYALMAFGGAGGLHAAQIADQPFTLNQALDCRVDQGVVADVIELRLHLLPVMRRQKRKLLM